MNELDFSGKQTLVIGGSSGIGNGIAQAFRVKGARVRVCGTRAGAADYSAAEGSDLEGPDYAVLWRKRHKTFLKSLLPWRHERKR
jgi:3-oxoacyl-[acyl-carrier protein] reductase